MSMEVNGNYSYVNSTYASNAKQAVQTTEEAKKAAEEAAAKKTDGFVKSENYDPKTYKPDMDKVNAMKSELKGNIGAFQQMVQGLVGKQAGQVNGKSLKDILASLKVDESTRAAAQQAISEDGEWGVEATATRIFDFAIALSGGDPATLEGLRGAVEKGFDEAEKVWGGRLPDISYQTRDRVMEMFDNYGKDEA